MHVIVVGCGRVGSGLALQLSDAGHHVSIVDKQPGAFRRLPHGWSGQKVLGFGFDRAHLEEAGATRADALAAVTSGDNSNILTARIARETYEIPNVVARIYDPRRAEIFQRLGIPTVPSVTWTIDQVFSRILPGRAPFDWTDSSGRLHVVERTLPASWAGKRINDAIAAQLPARVKLAAICRAGEPILDVSSAIGQEGDMLHLLVPSDADDAFRRAFSFDSMRTTNPGNAGGVTR